MRVNCKALPTLIQKTSARPLSHTTHYQPSSPKALRPSTLLHRQLYHRRPQLHAPQLLPQPPSQHRSALSTTSTMADHSIEEAKRKAATRAVEDHFDPSATYVGIGSGTTIIYVVEAIKERSTNPHIRFVPTGYQSRQVIVKAGLTPITFDSLPEDAVLDVAFDGADEVDEDLNCIKGGGACLFQEKLVAERARKFVCVADYRKDQSRLLTNWPSIPIEVAPIATHTVIHSLRQLGSANPRVRENQLQKAGPLKTDQDFFIVDAPFPALLTAADVAAGAAAGDGSDGSWEVERLSREIGLITGVLEVGLFCGLDGVQAERLRREGRSTAGKLGGQRPVAVYFGMQDGSVKVRTAPARG